MNPAVTARLCREGAHTIVACLRKIRAGLGREKDIEKVEHLTNYMQDTTLCPVGIGFSSSIGSMIKKFKNEFQADIA